MEKSGVRERMHESGVRERCETSPSAVVSQPDAVVNQPDEMNGPGKTKNSSNVDKSGVRERKMEKSGVRERMHESGVRERCETSPSAVVSQPDAVVSQPGAVISQSEQVQADGGQHERLWEEFKKSKSRVMKRLSGWRMLGMWERKVVERESKHMRRELGELKKKKFGKAGSWRMSGLEEEILRLTEHLRLEILEIKKNMRNMPTGGEEWENLAHIMSKVEMQLAGVDLDWLGKSNLEEKRNFILGRAKERYLVGVDEIQGESKHVEDDGGDAQKTSRSSQEEGEMPEQVHDVLHNAEKNRQEDKQAEEPDANDRKFYIEDVTGRQSVKFGKYSDLEGVKFGRCEKFGNLENKEKKLHTQRIVKFSSDSDAQESEMLRLGERKDAASTSFTMLHLERSLGGRGERKKENGRPENDRISKIKNYFETSSRLTNGNMELLPQSSCKGSVQLFNLRTGSNQNTETCVSQWERVRQIGPRDILDCQLRPGRDWPSQADRRGTDQSEMRSQEGGSHDEMHHQGTAWDQNT